MKVKSTKVLLFYVLPTLYQILLTSDCQTQRCNRFPNGSVLHPDRIPYYAGVTLPTNVL